MHSHSTVVCRTNIRQATLNEELSTTLRASLLEAL